MAKNISLAKTVVTKEAQNKEMVIGRTRVPTTNRNKIYFPKEGITKGMVLDYYQAMADYILPYLKDRPQSLKRNVNGIDEKAFFATGRQFDQWFRIAMAGSKRTGARRRR